MGGQKIEEGESLLCGQTDAWLVQSHVCVAFIRPFKSIFRVECLHMSEYR